jgi:hypothetical protein
MITLEMQRLNGIQNYQGRPEYIKMKWAYIVYAWWLTEGRTAK